MKKILIWPYQLYEFLFFIPYLIASTIFFGTIALILAFTISPRAGSLICGVTWARLLGYLTPIFVNVVGRNNVDMKQSYVVIANHQSQYDILVLYGWLGIDFKWIMKMELRSVPVLGVACEKVGHIFIDRSNRKKAFESLNKAKKTITGGTSVLFFPEGTRSISGELGALKKGAFRMALDLELPILPVSIEGTRNVLPSQSIRAFPGKVKMTIHEPIATDGYDQSNVEELMETARKVLSR
ncbi:MAG: 1-acyl-sn-glycerol-3-phosphate acyltransferase [Deltaproteobacteria bacterium]|nr:1-acyl-sn-glycerol-3-phosphate acyltransferase [Deltaproteobacteria bacterium]